MKSKKKKNRLYILIWVVISSCTVLLFCLGLTTKPKEIKSLPEKGSGYYYDVEARIAVSETGDSVTENFRWQISKNRLDTIVVGQKTDRFAIVLFPEKDGGALAWRYLTKQDLQENNSPFQVVKRYTGTVISIEEWDGSMHGHF